MLVYWTNMAKTGDGGPRILGTICPQLGFDLSESRVVDDQPVEDVLDLRPATSFPIVQTCRLLWNGSLYSSKAFGEFTKSGKGSATPSPNE